jgi:hypothetical protein
LAENNIVQLGAFQIVREYLKGLPRKKIS